MDIQILQQRFEDHEKTDDRRFDGIDAKLDKIMNNELEHIGNDIQGLKSGMIEVKTDLNWLKRFFWVVATASTGSLIAGLFNLLSN